MPNAKRMLVFHSAYTFEYLRKFGMEVFVQSRDAEEFFETVLTVSPLATLQYDPHDPRLISAPEFFQLDERNIILEGRLGRFHVLQRMKILNFIVAQISLVLTLYKHGKLRDVELIRAEDARLNGIYGYFFSRILQKPLVIGVWGNPGRLRKLTGKPNMPRLFPSKRIEELVEKFLLRCASIVLAQNSENMNYALEAGVDPAKTRITPLGVGIDKAHFLPLDERQDVSGDLRRWSISKEFVLVCISRLEALKMVDHAIRSCQVLDESHIPFKLILIGDGRERESLEHLAKELGLQNQIIFAGNRSQEWISGILARANLNIAPLCGRALLEASLAGCPAVSYNVDWHDEIVQSGITGELITNLDFRAMGETIQTLLENEDTRLRMSVNMRKLAFELADPAKIAREQVKIYQELIG